MISQSVMRSFLSTCLAGLTLFVFLVSCSGDDDTPQEINCEQEAARVQIEDDNDLGGMTVQFEVQYSGDLPIASVNWDFGDGTKGSGNSVSHLYVNSGTYSVQALVVLNLGGAECIADPETTVTIQ
ncbi:PKD domain-containing protein [Robiginitalea aurantiaca]|uniref:PKD domain-containing protein n=1 Tax=Robiginitalea aurantiaca TaxID=3056915 RepID=A0ABT7WI66_9FLAO|nr:PKD domain-containing protein [Robiginitalea aurantiaca]MDM9632627.1 PKD domain-containing protein [Robiginitalea aurantiaca]